MEDLFYQVSRENGTIMALVFCFAAIMAFAQFSYLYQKSQVDFYHSLPIKRGKNFAARFSSMPVTSQNATTMAWAQLLPLKNSSAAFILWSIFLPPCCFPHFITETGPIQEKSLAEFAAEAANKGSIVFGRHRRTNYARSRLQKLAEKPERDFSTNTKAR